jgi:hypothetical protein
MFYRRTQHASHNIQKLFTTPTTASLLNRILLQYSSTYTVTYSYVQKLYQSVYTNITHMFRKRYMCIMCIYPLIELLLNYTTYFIYFNHLLIFLLSSDLNYQPHALHTPQQKNSDLGKETKRLENYTAHIIQYLKQQR